MMWFAPSILSLPVFPGASQIVDRNGAIPVPEETVPLYAEQRDRDLGSSSGALGADDTEVEYGAQE